MVELMVIASCDECIRTKINWVASLKLIKKAVDRIGESGYKSIRVLIEEANGAEELELYNVPLMAKEFHEEELGMHRAISIFTKVLQRYGMMDQLKSAEKPLLVEQAGILVWNLTRFTTIRAQLLDIFAKQPNYRNLKQTTTGRTDILTGRSGGETLAGDMLKLRKTASLTYLDRTPVRRTGIHDKARTTMLKHASSSLSNERLSAEHLPSGDPDYSWLNMSLYKDHDNPSHKRAESAESVLTSPTSIFGLANGYPGTDGDGDARSPLYHRLFVFDNTPFQLSSSSGKKRADSISPQTTQHHQGNIIHRNSLSRPQNGGK